MHDSEIDRQRLDATCTRLRHEGVNVTSEELSKVIRLLRDDILHPYVNRLISHAEMILDIDPSHTESEILQIVARSVVDFLEAEYAEIWIYDRGWRHLASYPQRLDLAEGYLPLEESIVEELVQTHQHGCISHIAKERRWKQKEMAERLGLLSVLAVRIAIPRFSPKELDAGGVLQIFYKEADKAFTPVEIEVAKMFARRVSYTLARKRIKELQKFHVIKDKIVEQIFLRLSGGEGIKMKDLFNS